MLESDIKITVKSQAIAQRFWLNDGTRTIPDAEAAERNYVQGAFLPKQDWRLANSVELERLTDASGSWDLGKHIGIVKIPDELMQPLRQAVRLAPPSSEGAPNNQPATQDLCSYLQQSYALYDTEIKPLGMHHSQPGLVTTTVDTLRDRPRKPFVGLHLDSWENAPLRRRHLSNNRICINIGEGDRYFLLINLSLAKIFDLLRLSPRDLSKHYRGTQLPALFMQQFPDYPVVKIALAPNEAYIAPTENTIHDASTLGKQELDLSLTFLGKFGLAET